jgi:predicted esterase
MQKAKYKRKMQNVKDKTWKGLPRMTPCRLLLAVFASVAVLGFSLAQNFAPPPSEPPRPATLKDIADRSGRLSQLLDGLRRQGVRDPYLADVEIYHKAAAWIVQQNEFYQPEAVNWTLDALDHGLLRGHQLAQGEAPWYQQTGQSVLHAYRSRIDGSVQPYAVTLPADYGKDRSRKWRVDVVMHGRDPSLTEVKFLHQHGEVPGNQPFVRLDIYGRGNLGYRWAGESDLFEVLENFLAVERGLGREALLDANRVVLRGFSMGGAGTWHIGLHTPSRWCVLGPGAGFTTTHGYVKDLPEKLPPAQEACLHIYDAVDYAENVFDVPVVAYAGADDPQIQAARNIEDRLKPLHIPLTLLVAPGLKHQFPAEWQKKAEEAYRPFVAKGVQEFPPRVRFVTYTLRYPSCSWVEIVGLDKHYERAMVDAEQTEAGYTVKTTNVQALHLSLANPPIPLEVRIDGQTMSPRPYLSRASTQHLYLERRGGQWEAVLPQKLLTERMRKPRKMTRLQGPIDDAFLEPFLCVLGSGSAWHPETETYVQERLKRFQQEWEKHFRGQLPVKRDDEVTDEDLSSRHLILFGDPASNSLIGQILDSLPLRWTKEQIELGGKTYTAAAHVPVLIYPSPLSTSHYVVLNSGHTFHGADYSGTNALLYPRLGDYAILKPAPTEKDPAAAEVVTAGLFDEAWQIKNP